MTAKRFTKCDTKIRDNGEEMTQAEVRDMLNELDERCVDYHSLNETLRLEIQRLEAENEQLKQENGELQILNVSKEDYIKRKI